MVVYVVVDKENHGWYTVDIFHGVFRSRELAEAYVDRRDKNLNEVLTILEESI